MLSVLNLLIGMSRSLASCFLLPILKDYPRLVMLEDRLAVNRAVPLHRSTPLL